MNFFKESLKNINEIYYNVKFYQKDENDKDIFLQENKDSNISSILSWLLDEKDNSKIDYIAIHIKKMKDI